MTSPPSPLDLKIPPPLVALAVGAAMAALARAWPDALLPAGLAAAAGALKWLAAACAALLDLAGLAAFLRARTTINPLAPERSTRLVTGGVYRFTRNPMYLGMLLWLVAWGLHLAHAGAFALLPAFVLYLNRFQIGPEERALAARFGAQFADYRARVRRWL